MILGSETVVIRRKSSASEDAYGNPIQSVTEITVNDALISYSGGDEPVNSDSKPEIGKATLYFQPGTFIDHTDEFVFHGAKWVKDGLVQDWVSPFVELSTGTVVKVRQHNG